MKTTSLVLIALGLLYATPALGANSRSRAFLKNNVVGSNKDNSLTVYDTSEHEIPEPVHLAHTVLTSIKPSSLNLPDRTSKAALIFS